MPNFSRENGRRKSNCCFPQDSLPPLGGRHRSGSCDTPCRSHRTFHTRIFKKSFYSPELLQPLCGAQRPTHSVQQGITIAGISNSVLIFGLVIYGLQLFAEYLTKGRWARNVTALLGSIGLLFLAFALLLTPTNAASIIYIAQTAVWRVLLAISTTLLLAAIVAFGVITYTTPLRLWHERRVERRTNREVGDVP